MVKILAVSKSMKDNQLSWKNLAAVLRSLLIVASAFFLSAPYAYAQGQCGYADAINYPVDTNVFHLAQDFGVPSYRHQGRYHTGEDWFGGRANNYGYGTPVRAAATGRVTYSSPTGWGRDGGVVIIEHTFPDGTIAYSQYGHMADLDAAHFPAPYSCVKMGDIIGAVGDIRPAPHLHLEIRISNGDSPGPGYSWENPIDLGWRQPTKFLRNAQTWLQPAFRWHLDLRDESGPIAPPLQLDDNSLVYIDADRLGRVTPDGRSLWRINLEKPAVGITNFDDLPLLTYADGEMQRINLDGTFSERWQTGVTLGNFVLEAGESLIFHTPDNALVAFDAPRQQIRWRLENIQPVIRAQSTGQVIGILTADNQLLTLSLQGQLLDSANLREAASIVSAQNGTLIAYSRGGLWSILTDGTWSPLMEIAPTGGISGAVKQSDDGRLFLFDSRILYAYDSNRALLWQIELPNVTGLTELTIDNGILLLTGTHGDLIAIRNADGGLCNRAQIYGDDRAKLWYNLGKDGILRVAVADQIIGMDWQTFLTGCA
jgi:murein DD-endopeptidase MepM/ murein hydrolase activator NlpD